MCAEILPHLPNAVGHETTSLSNASGATPAATATAANFSGQSTRQMTLPGFSTLNPYTGLGGGHAETTRVRGPNSGFALDSGVHDDSAAIGQTQSQTPGLQEIRNGQIAQHPWRTYADSSCVQRTVARHAPIDSVLTPHIDQLGQVGIPHGNSSMEVGAFWDDATWYDDLRLT